MTYAHEKHIEQLRSILRQARNEASNAFVEAGIADAETGRDTETDGGLFMESDKMRVALNFIDWYDDEIGDEPIAVTEEEQLCLYHN